MDKLKYATISQIYVKDLICYDAKNISNLIKFCEREGIRYLPDKSLRKCYEYKKEEGRFTPIAINKVATLKPTNGIFEDEAIRTFGNDSDNVVFVIEDNRIIGVVHIVDYQKEFIYVELYTLIFRFENMVREALKLNGESNESFLCFIEEKARKNNKGHFANRFKEYIGVEEIEKAENIQKRKIYGEFQTFYFKDLIEFSNKKKHTSIGNVNEINELRNWVAHSKDIIKQEKDSNEIKLYNYEGLRSFINHIQCFFKNYNALQSRLQELKRTAC